MAIPSPAPPAKNISLPSPPPAISALSYSDLRSKATPWRPLFVEQQFAGAVRGLHFRLDERDAQLPFFQLEDAVDRAARRSGHRVFQQRRVITSFKHDAGRAFHRLRRE